MSLALDGAVQSTDEAVLPPGTRMRAVTVSPLHQHRPQARGPTSLATTTTPCSQGPCFTLSSTLLRCPDFTYLLLVVRLEELDDLSFDSFSLEDTHGGTPTNPLSSRRQLFTHHAAPRKSHHARQKRAARPALWRGGRPATVSIAFWKDERRVEYKSRMSATCAGPHECPFVDFERIACEETFESWDLLSAHMLQDHGYHLCEIPGCGECHSSGLVPRHHASLALSSSQRGSTRRSTAVTSTPSIISITPARRLDARAAVIALPLW